MKVSMLLLAAGRGRRLGGDVPKAWRTVGGRSLVEHGAARLARVHRPGEIVLAVHPDDRASLVEPRREALAGLGVTTVVDGGSDRQESMERALAAADPDAELVLVHDAARPFFPVPAAQEAVQAAVRHGAALLAVPVPDTLKRVTGEGRVEGTVDRTGLWLAQTPQVVRRDRLEEALGAARQRGFTGTDDVSLVERLDGPPPVVVRGSRLNLKVTTAEDLELAEWLAGRREAMP